MGRCSICNRTPAYRYKKDNSNKLLCAAHRKHLDIYGKIRYTKCMPNKIEVKNNYAEIILTNKQGIEIARSIIDINDINKVKKRKWYLSNNGTLRGYCISFQRKSKDKYCSYNTILLHQYLLGKAPKGNVTDHINRNKLDNRKKNLRFCSNQENVINSSLAKNNKSGKTGVYFDNTFKKWISGLFFNGKQREKKTFHKYIDALNHRLYLEHKYLKNFIVGD